MSLEKMSYDAATGTVIYHSKMHASLKRNFQVMSGAAWSAEGIGLAMSRHSQSIKK